jgi:predicted  nucleic acid-binding Zn-ribbon protein
MKACTGLWIVAPINRAVDDKTAKTLLGDSFKRQLKFDGTYSAVTFICSKTDDISVLEASESLGIDGEISESYERSEDLRRTKDRLKKQIVDLRAKKRGYNDTIEDIETRWDAWDDLRTKISEGETVYAPTEKSSSKKRKRQSKSSKSRKNHASSDIDDSDDDSESDWSDKENSQPTEEQTPLTEQEIEQTLASLKAQKKQIREDKRELDGEIRQISQQMEECQKERDTRKCTTHILSCQRAFCL